MKLFISTIIFAFSFSYSQAQDAYQIYNSKGKKVKTEKMLESTSSAEFVLFGEYHDNPISHWLQYEMMTYLFEKHDTNLVLGFEMFEQDQQQLMNDYLNNTVSKKVFKDSCRLWPNYKTDYKPLVDFAKEKSLNVAADNIPRRYASLMFKHGRDTLFQLSEEEKTWICPLDFIIDTTLSQYKEVAKMAVHVEGLDGYDLMQAQAIKDATMAYFILQNMNKDNVMLHFNGAFHSDFYQGIMWYLLQAKPDAEIVTISTVTQENISKLSDDNIGRADFIICVNENMTSTH